MLFAEVAFAASFAEPVGRWSCKPVQPVAPLIEIDFDEHEYRRCDQNICSSYDLNDASVQLVLTATGIGIDFGPLSRFTADLAGTAFSETVVRGTTSYVATGSCEFRSDSPHSGG